MNDNKYFGASEAELGFLKEIVRMLPAGLTVQDAHGELLLVNDAAAAQLGIDGSRPSPDLSPRREACRQALSAGQPVVTEEAIHNGAARQVLLTTHRPVRLAGRELLISASSDITEQKNFEDQLFRSAYFDELTGLPSRRVIEHHANGLLARDGGERFALAFLDVDNFKHINDYYGHAVGDALLVELSKRLGRDLRDSDMLSRISGDEFLLLLSPIQSQEEVAEFMQSTLERLTAPFFIDTSEVFASTSVGISLYPDHGRSFETLRQNADIAMYRIKNDGKGSAAFFDSSMEREALARMKVEQSLRLAILEKRFCCAFQSKVDIRTQAVTGIEALVRLRDDEGVIQAPGSFINLASELGLIDELTHLVLAEIVKSIDLINETFGAEATISINVAAKQAGNPEFMRSFAQALDDTGFPSRFMIEVTEDAFVAKNHFQAEILPTFRKLGVGISIDDFGIGYSSLSALADITADEIKIDRSFITDIHKRPRSQGILRAIESLSEALGMTVIAEGLESYEELAYLQAATKIRYAQGYYFSRPIFLEELKLVTPISSEARVNMVSRPTQQNRQGYSRASGYRR
ncbi:EAL domain-containing protein [Bradyrhizobium sp. 182]|uniref:putative bifunctional diguanylate cyclase/phosphodiesterase n=1 Tax=unclassified Bradyrhizobium TaxID=2631580 RepID=UPI001FFBE96E|nr:MULTISPECIES: EAL domain-containing protein [unclassified Bradyrhizobium]MCK1425692.1 EAL domain-containing protein [Bradyrhizobium sp. CW12]MCK1532251.1 EAL domain-containing protein [Bradyrhizobium sp. 182]MCK1594584.1 EAL domain-containing protein [Bradyrhizobium sp. 164]MCK1618203.1 EAL domain-containing protein [Bradyrhizobium sp. 159]MCK1644303.1 EAL domain-containing protein [Bradyrhizobium sp. 154]